MVSWGCLDWTYDIGEGNWRRNFGLTTEQATAALYTLHILWVKQQVRQWLFMFIPGLPNLQRPNTIYNTKNPKRHQVLNSRGNVQLFPQKLGHWLVTYLSILLDFGPRPDWLFSLRFHTGWVIGAAWAIHMWLHVVTHTEADKDTRTSPGWFFIESSHLSEVKFRKSFLGLLAATPGLPHQLYTEAPTVIYVNGGGTNGSGPRGERYCWWFLLWWNS